MLRIHAARCRPEWCRRQCPGLRPGLRIATPRHRAPPCHALAPAASHTLRGPSCSAASGRSTSSPARRAAVASTSSPRSSTRPWCGASSRTSVFRPRCRSRGPPVRRLRRPGSRSSLSTERPSASRPTSDCGRDSGGWRGTRRAREGTSAGAQPRARGRTRPEIDASAILNSPQSASRPENPPCTGLRACPTRRPKAPQQVRYRGADLAIGPLWRLSPCKCDCNGN